MKTMKVNDNLNLHLDNESQLYEVRIDNITKKVVYHSSEFSPITREQIQKLVDKLMVLKMITLIGEKNEDTGISINIWKIDETDDLYIETYHDGDYDDVSDFNMIMKYDEFLNL